ncbi:MAG: hypothetical protein K2Y27_10635 [Xanthobacteraceae bacterium]|nr:hypothetical protein [Xanthobacteraceae bacterium]
MAKKIGFLGATDPTVWKDYLNAFKAKLSGLGPIGGAPVSVIDMWAYGFSDQYEQLAKVFAYTLKVDVIVTSGTEPVKQAALAVPDKPIVFASAGGPLPALPNIHGSLNEQANPNLANKRFSILKQMLRDGPGPDPKVALLGNFGVANVVTEASNIYGNNGAGHGNQIDVLPRLDIRDPGQIEPAINALPNDVKLLYVCTDPMITEYQQVIIDTANAKSIAGPAGARLPTMFAFREYVARQGGGLMSMGPNFIEMFENAAVTAHGILSGMPLQRYGVKAVTQEKLVINTLTEAAIHVAIPNPVKQQAELWPGP